jgi:hypothetical protein
MSALEADAPAGGVEQAHDRAAGRRLAAAGLADEPEGLPGLDREADPVDGLHRADLALEQPAADREVLDEVRRPRGSPGAGSAAL